MLLQFSRAVAALSPGCPDLSHNKLASALAVPEIRNLAAAAAAADAAAAAAAAAAALWRESSEAARQTGDVRFNDEITLFSTER
eukprot:6212141-Pleurochrysis_carterae.AAC.2